MGDETRIIFDRVWNVVRENRYLRLYRERGMWVLLNRRTGSKHYYPNPRDVHKLLFAEPQEGP